jgi:hypothetical protein
MNISHRTHCVPSSILCALIYVIKERRPVRIAISAIEPGVDHAQAQVLSEEADWYWLSERWNGECMEAYTSTEPNHPDCVGKEPYRYVGLIEFLQEQGNALDIMNLL